MAGNRTGGQKSAAKIKAEYGADHYARIGAIGGSKGTTGGFYRNKKLARLVGGYGGKMKSKTLSLEERQNLQKDFNKKYERYLKSSRQ